MLLNFTRRPSIPVEILRERNSGTMAASHCSQVSCHKVLTSRHMSKQAYTFRRENVKRIVGMFLLILSVVNLTLAEETAFRGVKLADAKGKQSDASLIFSDSNKDVVVRVADHDVTTI